MLAGKYRGFLIYRKKYNSMVKISGCAGLWSKWMTKEEIDEIEKNIEERRKLPRTTKEENR
ncbi:MAG TPA: hypothetical protein VJA47_03880 [archaeon]|nr:hypothetical protein [archaeon]